MIVNFSHSILLRDFFKDFFFFQFLRLLYLLFLIIMTVIIAISMRRIRALATIVIINNDSKTNL